MKSIYIYIFFAFTFIVLSSQEKLNKVECKILINLGNDGALIKLVLKNNSDKDFETTPFGINHNALVIIDSDGEKTFFTTWKDGFKIKDTCKKGESLKYEVKPNELSEMLKKINKGKEYKV